MLPQKQLLKLNANELAFRNRNKDRFNSIMLKKYFKRYKKINNLTYRFKKYIFERKSIFLFEGVKIEIVRYFNKLH